MKSPLVVVCVAVVAAFVYLVFYYEAPEWPDMGRDICAYERVFNNCLTSARTNQLTGDHVVSQCSDAANNVTYRRKKNIEPECLQ